MIWLRIAKNYGQHVFMGWLVSVVIVLGGKEL